VDEGAAEEAPSIVDEGVELGAVDEDLGRREGEDASVDYEEADAVADEHGDLEIVGEGERARPALGIERADHHPEDREREPEALRRAEAHERAGPARPDALQTRAGGQEPREAELVATAPSVSHREAPERLAGPLGSADVEGECGARDEAALVIELGVQEKPRGVARHEARASVEGHA